MVGDRTELATLTEVFTEAGAEPGNCALGSVKSQIGHTKCAAGLAGLIKAALRPAHRDPSADAARHGPEPVLGPRRQPVLLRRRGPTVAAPPADRVAGVSAFGFGGTNFHAVLTGYDGAPPPAHGLDEWPAELFLLRGPDAVDRLARRWSRPTTPPAARGACATWR